MLYAKVVLGLSVEGPFDYIVPTQFVKKIKVGMRVEVSFGSRNMIGYVVKLSHKTDIAKLKTVAALIDEAPLLGRGALLLAREVSGYYCCSWGEAIETALPEALRKGRPLPRIDGMSREDRDTSFKRAKDGKAILLFDQDKTGRWDFYIDKIKKALENSNSVIILVADINAVTKTKTLLEQALGVPVVSLHSKQPRISEEWARVKSGSVSVVIGTRSAIFAPLRNLGLIIIDEEQEPVYKQDQVPHYHAREVAFMRHRQEGAELVLCSTAPSLETIYLTERAKLEQLTQARTKEYPEVKIIDLKNLPMPERRRSIIFSAYLRDAVVQALASGQKTLLFLNRRGFATVAACTACAAVLKCERCSTNLVYHFKENILSCHYCNFKIKPPSICPYCGAGYIKYSGAGTEKLESELSRMFPQARVKVQDKPEQAGIEEADIFVSTESIVSEAPQAFSLVGVLNIDTSLNRVDFRAGEKTFALLMRLLSITDSKMVIQTRLPLHHAFRSLTQQDSSIFYSEELKQRRQFSFPPYRHLGIVKVRGRKESRAREVSAALFERMRSNTQRHGVDVISLNPAQPLKLRGNFYWQILLRSNRAERIRDFLKISLKNFPHSGIIVTADIDPL